MREWWVETGGARLYVREDGAGTPLVMLHGGMADHRAVLPLVQPLADRCRVVTPDLRGSGRSWYGGALTFDRLTGDLAALLAEAGMERAVIGGVSSGTGPALHFARAYPSRTRALILVKPVYGGSALGYEPAQREQLAEMDALARRAPDEGVGVLRPLYQGLPETMRAAALAMLEGFDAASVATTSRFLAGGEQPFHDGPDLESVAVPTLLIRGDDPMHPPAVSDLYATSLPDCRALPADTAAADAIEGFLSDL